MQVDKFRHHQGGIADLRFDHGAACEIQEYGRSTGGNGQALRAKAAHEVHRRDGLGRIRPARTPVHPDVNIATFELEDVAAAEHAEEFGRCAQCRELGHLFHKFPGGGHDGQGHVHILNGQAEGA